MIFVRAYICTAEITLMVCIFISVSVTHGYDHFRRHIARLVGCNDSLFAGWQRQRKLTIFINRRICTVYGHAVKIQFCHGNRMRRTVCLAAFNARNHRRNCIQYNLVGIDICHIAACVSQLRINHIGMIQVEAQFPSIWGKGRLIQFIHSKCSVA